MRGFILFALVVFSSPASWAVFRCQEIFRFVNIEAPQERTLLFKRLEVFRRNNNIGPQQQGEQMFDRWIEIPPFQENIFNYIALTPEGRLYHVVDGMDRQIARLLSGPLQIKQFYIYKKSILVAVDSDQRVLFFDPKRWMKSPLGGLTQKGFMVWAGITTTVTLAMYQFLPEALSSQSLMLLSGVTGVAAGINTFLVMLARYDRLNTYPNGFVDSGLRFAWTGLLNQQLEFRTPEDWIRFATKDHFVPPDARQLPPQLNPELSEALR